MKQTDHTVYDGETVPEGWMFAAGMLGLPVEIDIPDVRIRPWATWILAGSLALVWGLTQQHGLEGTADAWGLLSGEPLRKGGLTLLSSFFIHGGLVHFISNLYFLLIFGDNVEEALGWKRYLVLVGAGAVVGGALHALADPNPAIPCIGASGGISGILACYALLFPKGQIAILGFFLFWIRIPVIIGFALWLAMQLYLAVRQGSGLSHISAFSHLGGLLAGLGVWALWLRGHRHA